MTVATRRTVDEARAALNRWLAARSGLRDAAVIDIAASKGGFSNESFVCDIESADGDGARDVRRFVLRIEPTAHQLFAKSDAALQAKVLRGLADIGCVPVPRVPYFEDRAEWFGAPFYLMDFVAGAVPSDMPSYHKKGWVADLSAAQRALLYDNALDKLADLHTCADRFDFLEPPAGSSHLSAYVDSVSRWAASFDSDLVVNRATIDAALEFVRDAQPAESEPVIVWGDARIGNMIFAEDLSVAALLDWEATTMGPAAIDVGWWLMFENYICEADGLKRLDGIPGRGAILARYESLVQHTVDDVAYFEVLASLVFSIINSRLAALLMEMGFAEDRATKFVKRSTRMIEQGLAAANA